MHAGGFAVGDEIADEQPGQSAPASASRQRWNTTENAVFDQLCAVVDLVSAEELRSRARKTPGLRIAILEHHNQVFACATSAGSRQKERDWLTYLHVVDGQDIPSLAEVCWLPKLEV